MTVDKLPFVLTTSPFDHAYIAPSRFSRRSCQLKRAAVTSVDAHMAERAPR